MIYTFSNPRHKQALEIHPSNERLVYNFDNKRLGQHSARLSYREPIPNYSSPKPVKDLYKQDASLMKEQPKSNYNDHYNKFNNLFLNKECIQIN